MPLPTSQPVFLTMRTRSGFAAAPLSDLGADGRQPPCPVDNCGSFLAPTERNNAIEYNCVVGGHGQIILEKNGKMVVVAPVLLAADGTLQVLSNRPRCAEPLCNNFRRTACGRKFCSSHCTLEESDCGCADHDKARNAPVHAGLVPEPEDAPPPANQPVDPWEIIGWVHDIPIRAVDAPAQARIMLQFSDQEWSTFAIVAGGSWSFDLSSLDAATKHDLEWEHIQPGSLKFINGVGEETTYVGGAIPMFPSLINGPDNIGEVSLRAQTVADLSQFPPSSYVDTVKVLKKLSERTCPPCNQTNEQAYAALFQHEPTRDDLEAIRICREILEESPSDVRKKFRALKRQPGGSWALFLKACDAAAQADPLTTAEKRALFKSPLAYRQRRPRGLSTRPPSSSLP